MRQSLWMTMAAVVMGVAVACNDGGTDSAPEPAGGGAATAAGGMARGDAAPAPGDSLGQRALRAAGVAREIQGDPDRAAEILAEHGLSQEQFEALLFEIAADPEASEIYAGALQP